jgi:hypothetical protein
MTTLSHLIERYGQIEGVQIAADIPDQFVYDI